MQPSKVRVRLAIAGLVLTFALGLGTHPTAAAQAPPASKGPPIIYQKARSFRIPFQIDPAELARRRELQLWSSDDQGRHWKQKGVTTPDRPAFTFTAEQDGEYWLAVRSVDSQGRLFPADEAQDRAEHEDRRRYDAAFDRPRAFGSKREPGIGALGGPR